MCGWTDRRIPTLDGSGGVFKPVQDINVPLSPPKERVTALSPVSPGHMPAAPSQLAALSLAFASCSVLL